MLYQITFIDGTKYDGGMSYKETLWKEIPDKEIREISFRLPDGNWITLKGYESYNHIVEATQDVYGSNKFTLRYQYLMGKVGNKTHSYRITLFQTKDDRYRIGDITRREFEYGKEYNNQPTQGWKKGII